MTPAQISLLICSSFLIFLAAATITMNMQTSKPSRLTTVMSGFTLLYAAVFALQFAQVYAPEHNRWLLLTTGFLYSLCSL